MNTRRPSRRLRSWLAPVLVAAVLIVASQAGAQTVIRGPYLQEGSDTSVKVLWRTSAASESTVVYGTEPGSLSLSSSDATPVTNHVVALSALSPGTRYYYAISVGGSVVAGGDLATWFETSPVPGSVKATRIWVIGDSGTANGNAADVYDAYRFFEKDVYTDLWLMLGDNAYVDGTDAEYQSAVFDAYPELLAQTPLWSTLGNHDGHSADSATQTGPYYDIFDLPSAGEVGGEPSGTEAYYSFDYANIHFVVLESYETDRSTTGAMYTWLEADLQAAVAGGTSDWLIAFWHHPPYSKGSHDSDSETPLVEMRSNFLPLLESYGADLVLSGHSHAYERSFLIDGHYGLSGTFGAGVTVDAGSGQPGDTGAYEKATTGHGANEGTVYVVAGSSGLTSGGSLDHPAMFVSLNTLGSLVLDVNGPELFAIFLDDFGTVQDFFQIQKGPAPATSSISGRVFEDVDGNGLRGAEPDLSGIPVDLRLGNGALHSSTTSVAGGAYSFSGLNAGSYLVAVTPGARSFTTPGVGGDPTVDSDFDAASGRAALSLAEGEARTDVDAGLLDGYALGLANIDLSDPAVEPYAGLDTAFGTAEAREAGSAYYTQGTRWIQTLGSFDVDPQTELSFEFRSQKAGVPSAIGFDDDGDPTTGIRLFDLSGSGPLFAHAIPQSYEGAGGWQQYRIPVGQFFTGTGLRLVLGVSTSVSTSYDYLQGERIYVDGEPTATIYTGTHDAELRSVAPGTNFDTGTGSVSNPELAVDQDDPSGTGNQAQGVMRFDGIFGAASWQIPPAATIDQAWLFIDIDDTGNDLGLYELTSGFGAESSVTWSSVGGGIDPATQTTNVPIAIDGFGDKEFIDVTATVQAWSNGTANHGWAFLSTGANGVHFDASENTASEDRPALLVTTLDLSLANAAETEIRAVQLPEPRVGLGLCSGILLLALLAGPRRRGLARVAGAALVALLVGGVEVARAHTEPDGHILELTKEIEASDAKAPLLVQRGRLWQEGDHLEEALADFERARSIDPKLAPAEYHAAEALIGLSRFDEALAQIERFRVLVRGNAAATTRSLRLRASAFAAAGRREEAAADWQRFFAAAEAPAPDDYLAWSRSLEPDTDAALAAIARGTLRLGPIASLERRAYALEMHAARYAQASQRAERWLRKRDGNVFVLRYAAEAYAKQGREQDARDAWRKILAATRELPTQRRSAAFAELEGDARRALAD